MKRILVTSLLLSCLTLVGCNPITVTITPSEDLSNISVEVDGFSLDNINVEEDGSVNVSFDNPGSSADELEDVVFTDTSMQNASDNVQQDTTSENVMPDHTTADGSANATDNTSATQEQPKDSYGVFKELVTNHLTSYDNIHCIGLNPEAVDFSFISKLDNDWVRVEKAYVLHLKDIDRVFLVISYDEMSADYVTEVYEVSDDVPTYCVTKENVRILSYEPNSGIFSTEVTINVMGTYWATMDYVLDDNGDFLTKGSVFAIDSSYNVERHTLTIIKELPVCTEDGYENLQPGTQILITGTNNENEMYFTVVGTGKEGIISYEEAGEYGNIVINGVSESEYFEYMSYAG